MARRKLKRKFNGTLDEENAFYAGLDAKHMVLDQIDRRQQNPYNFQVKDSSFYPVYKRAFASAVEFYTLMYTNSPPQWKPGGKGHGN